MTATAPQAKPFDIVFDSQAIFRTVLDAMARPGTIGLLTALDPRCPLPDYRPLTAVARTLLDHEVTFAVIPEEACPTPWNSRATWRRRPAAT